MLETKSRGGARSRIRTNDLLITNQAGALFVTIIYRVLTLRGNSRRVNQN